VTTAGKLTAVRCVCVQFWCQALQSGQQVWGGGGRCLLLLWQYRSAHTHSLPSLQSASSLRKLQPSSRPVAQHSRSQQRTAAASETFVAKVDTGRGRGSLRHDRSHRTYPLAGRRSAPRANHICRWGTSADRRRHRKGLPLFTV